MQKLAHLLILTALAWPTFVSARQLIEVLQRGSNIESTNWQAEPIFSFSSLELPRELTKPALIVALQTFIEQRQGFAFRHIGDWRDFDHAHLLKVNGTLRALLFHTQEQAHRARLNSPFGFVNKEARNWIVFMQALEQSENARLFKFDEKPAFWASQFERNVTWEEYESKGTIVAQMLDPRKLGFQIDSFLNSEKAEQFYFKKAKCPRPEKWKTLETSNIMILNDTQGPVCLYVTTMACVFSSHFKCPAKPLRSSF